MHLDPKPDPRTVLDAEADAERCRSRRRLAGFAVVGAVLVAAAWIALPRIRLPGVSKNEFAAMATLRNVASAQAWIQAHGLVDADRDGVGEPCWLSEMARVTAAWASQSAGSARRGTAPLGPVFGRTPDGRSRRRGYVFELFLPAKDGGWASEREVRNGRAVDAAKCRTTWVCYAWPETFDWTGRRVFLLHASGDLLSMPNSDGRIEGEHGPRGGAAGFLSSEPGARAAANCADCEGNWWTWMG